MLKIIIWILGLLFVWILIAPYVCNPKSDKATQKRLEEEKKKADEVVRQREASPKAEPKPKSPYVYAEPLEPTPTPSIKKPAQSEKQYIVAGTTYYVDAIMRFAHENPKFAMNKREIIKAHMENTPIYKYSFDSVSVTLEPEPDNPKDPKAIKVLFNGAHIGYIKAGSCAHIHKLLKSDRIVSISGYLYGGPCKQVTRYSNDPSDTEYETTNNSIGAKIKIVEKAE